MLFLFYFCLEFPDICNVITSEIAGIFPYCFLALPCYVLQVSAFIVNGVEVHLRMVEEDPSYLRVAVLDAAHEGSVALPVLDVPVDPVSCM